MTFERRLRSLGVVPKRVGPWLSVGEPRRGAGWKLHVSASLGSLEQLLTCVVPCLVGANAQFKLAADRSTVLQLACGNLGESQVGKVLTVYPRSDAEAVALARNLIEATRDIAGPRIPTDLHLGGSVYARYGAICPRLTRDRFGAATELIPDGNGQWIEDRRATPFTCPRGIENPFLAFALPAELPGDTRKLLAGRFFVTDVLRPALGGSVFRAIERGKPPTLRVLKQARAHFSEDEQRRDQRARLRNEAAVMSRLQGIEGVAAVGDYFEESGAGYLSVAYVPGTTLGTLVHRYVSGRAWTVVPAAMRRRLLSCCVRVLHLLRSAHARGVLHRDVTPSNIWIADDARVFLLDWECAYVVGSRSAPFRLGTAGYTELSQEGRVPAFGDDWIACARVLIFVFTGMNPTAVVHGRCSEIERRLVTITGLGAAGIIHLLAAGLADRATIRLTGAHLLREIEPMTIAGPPARPRRAVPLWLTLARESVMDEALAKMAAALRRRLRTLATSTGAPDPSQLDAHSGLAGLLCALSAAQAAGVAALRVTDGEDAARHLLGRTSDRRDLPGLVHGRAGRALAVASAMQAGAIQADGTLRRRIARALRGRLDWPDFTHGAAGQGIAALACARRLRAPSLAAHAGPCADYLVRTQQADGSWILPDGVAGASGERYTGFAHGVAGIMGFLARYAAHSDDPGAAAAWQGAERWLISGVRRARGGRYRWSRTGSRGEPSHWWCHGEPGIALGWLGVARVQGLARVDEEHLRRALAAIPLQLKSESLGFCHGLAGIGEICLEAGAVLGESAWQEAAARVVTLLVSMFRRRFSPSWHCIAEDPSAAADGLMLGAAGIVHFLLRAEYPEIIDCPPLHG